MFRRRSSTKAVEDDAATPYAQTKQPKSARLNFLRVAICAAREAGTVWSKQCCGKWCAKHALPPLTACAAAVVLTVVLARAESFTLAVVGLMIELSDVCNWSTPSSPTSGRMALLEDLQPPSPTLGCLQARLDVQMAAAFDSRLVLGRTLECCCSCRRNC